MLNPFPTMPTENSPRPVSFQEFDLSRPHEARVLNSKKNRRVLVIDDNPAIHDDFRKILCGKDDDRLSAAETALFGAAPREVATTHFELDFAGQGQEGFEMIRQAEEENSPYAVAFIDVRMPPGWDGIETATQAWEVCPDLQIVICTAYSDYSWEEMIAKLGHSDRLLILKKPFDNVEVLQLASALTVKWQLTHQSRLKEGQLEEMVKIRTSEQQLITEQLGKSLAACEQSASDLRQSEERFRTLSACSPVGIFVIDASGQCTYCNARWSTISGLTIKETLGDGWSQALLPEDREATLEEWRKAAAVRGEFSRESRLRCANGETRWVLLKSSAMRSDAGEVIGSVATVSDITEQRNLEEQLRQSQKMEAIGQLSGGVAHDFNNILMIINGYAEMLLTSAEFSAGSIEGLKQIYLAGERAANLTRQLLTFSRKQPVRMKVIDLDGIVTDLAKMLRRLVGENIVLQTNSSTTPATILADTSMIEQILLNLAVNARDAMPKGGQLTIEVSRQEMSGEYLSRHPQARAGKFVSLSVKDTGCGISADILTRIFEPFFTTKEPGKGTGLGLATVFGIVQQHEGWITVESTVDVGTAFTAYFPEVLPTGDGLTVADEQKPIVGGDESILVVEDEEAVRELAVIILQKYGYRVLQAASGPEALKVWERHGANIKVLITDVVMPGEITGLELAGRLEKSKPGLKVIYTTGYSAEMMGEAFDLHAKIPFLQKPYLPSDLGGIVRACIDGN